MTESYRERLEGFLLSMKQVRQMQELGILTLEDYSAMETVLADKYGISTNSLFRSKTLLEVYSRQS